MLEPAADTRSSDPPPDLNELLDDDRVRELRDYGRRWLRGFRSAKSRTSNAERLGMPRDWVPSLDDTAEARSRRRSGRGYTGNEYLLWCWQQGVPYFAPSGDDLNRWLDQLAHVGYASRTQTAMLSSVSSFFRHLIREGVLTGNPANTVDRRTRNLQPSKQGKVGKPLTFEQVRALLEGAYLLAARTRNGLRDRAMLELLAGTGMRADEVVQLDRADYHRPSPGAPADLTITGKGGHTRTIGVPVEVADAVDDYHASLTGAGALARHGEPGGRARQPLLTSATGGRLHTSHVPAVLKRVVDTFTPQRTPREQWKRELLRSSLGARVASELAPLRGHAHPHRLRHAYGTHAIEAGVPIRQVQRDLGHADVATTETYVHDQQQAANSASHQLAPGLHRGWLAPRTTAHRARAAERDELPGQTAVPMPGQDNT